jgi:hypothetical protein
VPGLGTKRLSSLFALVLLLLLVAASPVLADDAANAVGSMIFIIICGGLCVVVSAACGIYALYFLYTDAEARSGNGILWLLLGLFIGWPWILIIWLIIRPEKRM